MLLRAFTLFLLIAAPAANACAPTWITFERGSGTRLNVDDRASIAFEVRTVRATHFKFVHLIAQTDETPSSVQMARRRANAVKAEFVRQGVPPRSITIETRGAARRIVSGGDWARIVVVELRTKPTMARSQRLASC